MPVVASFEQALRGDTVAVIAEVKRSSPSRGAINPGLDAGRLAQAFEAGGAAAISVLTEPARFGGSLVDLASVRAAIRLPMLKKDFHVARPQLLEARAVGASAALIIVRAIEPGRLLGLAETARDIGLEILFEVRDERELARALDVGARIIGVNNRNLETLEIDPATVGRVLPCIPLDCLAVAESGYSTRSDVEGAARAGADAVLIGSSLSAAVDPSTTLRELAGVRRSTRGRKRI